MVYNIESKADFDQVLVQVSNGDMINGNGVRLELKHSRYNLIHNLEFRSIIFDKVWPNDSNENYVTFNIVNYAGLTMSNCEFTPSNEDNTKRICYIKAEDASYLEVERCIFNRSNYMGIHTYDVRHAVVRDCDFNYDSPQGYGYGIWQGGSGAIDQQLRVFDSRFRKTRHAVAAHYSSNDIHIERCEFSENVQQVLDRHAGEPGNSNAWGVGGGNYTVINNTFHDPFSGPVDVQVPLNGKMITVYNNVFSKPFGKNLKIEAMIGGVKTVLNETNSHPQLAWGKNYYMI